MAAESTLTQPYVAPAPKPCARDPFTLPDGSAAAAADAGEEVDQSCEVKEPPGASSIEEAGRAVSSGEVSTDLSKRPSQAAEEEEEHQPIQKRHKLP